MSTKNTTTITVGIPLVHYDQLDLDELRTILTKENYTTYRAEPLAPSAARLVNVAVRMNVGIAESIRARAEQLNMTIIQYTGALLDAHFRS